FARIVAEALPGSTAKVSFMICMKAWEVLDNQTQLDGTVNALLRGLTRIRDMVDIASQASTSTLATCINRSKDPVDGILALLEDVSVYIFSRYSTNDLAHIPAEDAADDNAYDVEAYLARLEDLQKAFHSSWLPTATSITYPSREVVDESSDQNNHIMVDEPTKTTDPYELLDRLRPMDPSGYDPRRACLEGTREVILNRIITWTQNRDNSEGFMWISGQVGMGKTSIATSLCQKLDNIRALAGSFFCRRDDPDSSDPLRLMNNLIHEISLECPAYAQEVANAVRSNRKLCTAHVGLRYEGLIKGPLEKLRSLSQPTTLVVIVDGLDECGDCDSREQILHQLYDMSRLVPWLKVIITARPTRDLQEFSRNNCPDEPIVHLDRYDAAPDIRAYIQGQLGQLAEKESWPPGSIDQLCAMSQGVFLWATLATKHIKKSTFLALSRLQKVLNKKKSPVTDHFDAVYSRLWIGARGDAQGRT
ncbi:hypothetical protein FRC11_002523, partial [Ceratobasidium sp. 423]